MNNQKEGFFQALLDLSFTKFITSKIITVLYIVSIALSGLATLFLIIFAFRASAGLGVFTLLIGGPIFFLLNVIYARIMLEIIMVIFRIALNTGEIVNKLDVNLSALQSESTRRA